jgi:hypothetical protein
MKLITVAIRIAKHDMNMRVLKLELEYFSLNRQYPTGVEWDRAMVRRNWRDEGHRKRNQHEKIPTH